MHELDALQTANLAEIASLNQRSGRTLSIVDLIADGTLDVSMAAYLLAAVADGVSMLTAAGPGGTGKSTLLANLLSFLPPDEEIISVSGAEIIAAGMSSPQRACYVAHEIGDGHWYGYIWGAQVPAFFDLARHGHRIAAAIHADTLRELAGRLYGAPLGVSEAQLEAIRLICFMRMDHTSGGSVRRRVTRVHSQADGAFAPAYTWNPVTDGFEQGAVEQSLSPLGCDRFRSAQELIRRLVAEEVDGFAACRAEVLAWYGERVSGPPRGWGHSGR